MTVLTVDAVLFDMDGTLVDSTAAVELMWTEFAIEVGADPATVIEYAHGRPSTATIAHFAPHDAAQWTARIHAGEAERFTEVTAILGAVELVRAIPEHRWAVVTSAVHGPARDRLSLVGISPPRIVIGADDVTHGKPHPEGFLAAASGLGVNPANCVVFEDTQAGALAGLAAGCAVVLVGTMAGDVPGVTARVTDLSVVTIQAAGDRLTVSL